MEIEEKRDIQSGGRYILAFIIGTLIFILGFALTYSISYIQYDRISNFQDITSYSIFSDKLGYEIFSDNICSFSNFKEISDELGYQGKIINDLEKKLGKNNKDVLFRKRFYTLVELEHFEFVNKVNKDCNRNISTILFFYSNLEGDIDRSESAGKVLDALVNRHNILIVYSFDINLDSELITELKNKYLVYSSPVAIVNGKIKVDNFSEINKFEDVLGNEDFVQDDVIRLG